MPNCIKLYTLGYNSITDCEVIDHEIHMDKKKYNNKLT